MKESRWGFLVSGSALLGILVAVAFMVVLSMFGCTVTRSRNKSGLKTFVGLLGVTLIVQFVAMYHLHSAYAATVAAKAANFRGLTDIQPNVTKSIMNPFRSYFVRTNCSVPSGTTFGVVCYSDAYMWFEAWTDKCLIPTAAVRPTRAPTRRRRRRRRRRLLSNHVLTTRHALCALQDMKQCFDDGGFQAQMVSSSLDDDGAMAAPPASGATITSTSSSTSPSSGRRLGASLYSAASGSGSSSAPTGQSGRTAPAIKGAVLSQVAKNVHAIKDVWGGGGSGYDGGVASGVSGGGGLEDDPATGGSAATGAVASLLEGSAAGSGSALPPAYLDAPIAPSCTCSAGSSTEVRYCNEVVQDCGLGSAMPSSANVAVLSTLLASGTPEAETCLAAKATESYSLGACGAGDDGGGSLINDDLSTALSSGVGGVTTVALSSSGSYGSSGSYSSYSSYTSYSSYSSYGSAAGGNATAAVAGGNATANATAPACATDDDDDCNIKEMTTAAPGASAPVNQLVLDYVSETGAEPSLAESLEVWCKCRNEVVEKMQKNAGAFSAVFVAPVLVELLLAVAASIMVRTSKGYRRLK